MQTTFKKHYPLFIGLGLFLISFAVYLTALSPTVQPRDNPDVVTAAITLGIPHSPGYPLYTILGFIFTKIIPFGSLVWRVNFMSAIFSAMTIFVIYLIIWRLTKKILPALAGAAVLAFSYNYFLQSLYADYLSLNNLLVALAIYFLLIWREQKNLRFLYLFSFLFGLAYSHHQLSLILLPAFLYFILATDKKILIGWELPKLLGFFILGLLPFLYLPIRASQNPVYTWGEPTTLQGFWAMISRQDYTGNDFSYLGNAPFRIWDWLKSISWQQFTFLGFILAILGFFEIRRKDKILSLFFLLLVILSGPTFALFSNVPNDPMEIAAMQRFYIFSIMLFAIFIGLGILWLENRIKKASYLALILPLILIINHYPQVDRKNYYYTYDLGQNIFKSLPENSVIFAGYDVPLFELQYLQIVEGQRKDVKIIPGADPTLIKIPDWMTKRVQKDFPDYSLPIGELSQKYPVYTNMNTELFWGDKARDFIPEGLVYHYPPDKNWQENFDGKIAQENFQKYTYRGTYSMTNQTDTFTQEILFHYANAWTNLGMVFQKKNQPEKAALFYQKALEISPENLIAWVNFAGTLLDRGMYNEARQEYKKILKVYPDSDIARNGLTVAEQKLNR